MKFKKNARSQCLIGAMDVFLYADYLKLDDLLEPEDAERVKQARAVIVKFWRESQEKGLLVTP